MVRNLNLYGTSRGRTPVTGFHHLGANACLGGIQGGGAQDLGQHQILALKPWISTFFQSWPKNLFLTQVYLEIAFKCHQKCFWVRAPPTWVSPRLSWRCNGLKSIQIWARKLLFKTHPEQNKTTFKCIEMRVRADIRPTLLFGSHQCKWCDPALYPAHSFEQVSGVKHKKWLQHDDSLRFHLRWYTFGLSTDAMIRIWHKFCNSIKLNSKWGKV